MEFRGPLGDSVPTASPRSLYASPSLFKQAFTIGPAALASGCKTLINK